ncbi:hypothetical protein [Bergeyella sp. RCAD1439]|uniref:hypothetical protein n=1 Tax=Bergeyella anatis TaxID=3113737 RepID=UPI002E1904CC|nr:hypothetical protein [Bergeyella sp. RCAD1439]
MKKIFFSGMIFLGIFILAQKRLYDPTIVAQEKRQVFESWGDWRPYPKYAFGIQTNFSYATVWGWMAPRRNRLYKQGADIRPLKVGGIETQRLVEVKIQESETEKIKVEIDSIYKRNIQDFAYWTPETVEADPLWILYYKRMLRPLQEFPSNPYQWGIKNFDTYKMLLETGKIEQLQKTLDILKDKYRISRTVAMPRGKRFLLYHECLLGWRRFKNMLSEQSEKTTLVLEYENLFTKKNLIKKETQKSDLEIVKGVIDDYKKNENKYE